MSKYLLRTALIHFLSVMFLIIATACTSSSISETTTDATKPSNSNGPVAKPTSDPRLERECIEHYQVINQKGKYSPNAMQDDEYIKALEKVLDKGLTRATCGEIWDRFN